MTNYWIKNDGYKEVITKTQIPNKHKFNLLACCFNLLDKRGLALQLNTNSEIETDQLFRKNGFEYVVFENNKGKELMVLPNESITDLAERVASKLGNCKTENDVLKLLITAM